MKRILVIVIGVVVALGTAAVVGSFLEEDSAEERVDAYLTGTEEREYLSAEGGFKATFPGAPERSTETTDVGGTPTTLTFFSKELGDAAFTVVYFDYPAGGPFDLDAGANGAAAAVDGKLETASRLTVQGHQATEFVISAKEGVFVKGLLIRAPNRVYQLQVVGKDNPPGGYDKFKASFLIT